MENNREINNKTTAVETSHTVVEDIKLESQINKNRLVRILYIIGGTLSIVLAIIGIVLPGLPTTPFVLLSAFLFAKSSKKLHDWLLSNKVFGPRIKDYNRKKGVTRKGKVSIILFMSLMVTFSAFIVIKYIPIRIAVISLGLIGVIVVWFFVPTAQD